MEFGLNTTLDVLRVMLAANIPVKLESLPGAGKTSHINALFEATGGYLKTMVAVNHDPTDFGGIPKPEVDFYRLLPGEWAVELSNAVSTHPIVGLFLDEINTAGRAVLAALLKVVDERLVGFHRLPPEVRMILAMNPAEANGGVDLTPAMANRVAHLEFNYPLKLWAENVALGTFAPPAALVLPTEDALVAETVKYGKFVAEFSQSGVDGFEKYPEEADLRSKAFPTRRTWSMGARAMAAADLLGFNSSVRRQSLESLVGRRAADEYDDYMDTKGGLDPDGMLSDPEGFTLPDRDDALFTALDRMTNKALSISTQDSVDAACKVLMRVSAAGRPGVGASGMRSVALFLREHREFISPVVQSAIREFKPVIEAAGGMEATA